MKKSENSETIKGIVGTIAVLFLIWAIFIRSDQPSDAPIKPDPALSSSESTASQEDETPLDAQELFQQAKNLLERGKIMASNLENGNEDGCIHDLKEYLPKAKILRQKVNKLDDSEHFQLSIGMGHLLSCLTCLDSRESCDVTEKYFDYYERGITEPVVW